MIRRTLAYALLLCWSATGQSSAPDAAGALKGNFNYVNRKMLAMAEGFPAAKYSFKLRPEMRSFGAVLVHVASGNVYAGKAGMAQSGEWSELSPDSYKTKEQCVALLRSSIAAAEKALSANPLGPHKNLEPFLSVLQHSSEHYGLLVAYYRANGMKPPEIPENK